MARALLPFAFGCGNRSEKHVNLIQLYIDTMIYYYIKGLLKNLSFSRQQLLPLCGALPATFESSLAVVTELLIIIVIHIRL